MIPWKVRCRPYPLLIALSHGVVRQLEGKTPYRCTMWYSRSTALTPRRYAKDVTGIFVITGSPSKGSSPQHPNNQWYGL